MLIQISEGGLPVGAKFGSMPCDLLAAALKDPILLKGRRERVPQGAFHFVRRYSVQLCWLHNSL